MVKRTQTRFIVRMIKGALPAASMPGFIRPQLATLKSKAPAGDRWVHEKSSSDGYRLQIHLQKGKVTIYTRNGHDWTNRFPLIAMPWIFRSSGHSLTVSWWSFTTAERIFPSCRPGCWPAKQAAVLRLRPSVSRWLRPPQITADRAQARAQDAVR